MYSEVDNRQIKIRKVHIILLAILAGIIAYLIYISVKDDKPPTMAPTYSPVAPTFPAQP